MRVRMKCMVVVYSAFDSSLNAGMCGAPASAGECGPSIDQARETDPLRAQRP